jgi:DNA-binding MarR family transcriptional regulator
VPAPTTPPDATTGEQLALAVLTVARRLKRHATAGRLDPASLYVLYQVDAKAPLRVTELARCMALDASTVSRHVRHLEDGGYLARTGDPDDRRATRVRLTLAGRQALEEATRATAAVLDALLADWPAADRAALTSLLARLASSTERLTPETET